MHGLFDRSTPLSFIYDGELFCGDTLPDGYPFVLEQPRSAGVYEIKEGDSVC